MTKTNPDYTQLKPKVKLKRIIETKKQQQKFNEIREKRMNMSRLFP